jgi:putative zinc finger/helix-turn-helix YgiT family protein
MSKNKETSQDAPCFECESGTLEAVVQDFETNVTGIGDVVVPNVPMERCDQCGDVVIGDAGNRIIDTYLYKLTSAITPTEIQAFLDKYSITQKEAAEITGYGEKNISRWLRGHMRPSKSVSNNIRTLLASTEAFEVLKTRNWKHPVTHEPVI